MEQDGYSSSDSSTSESRKSNKRTLCTQPPEKKGKLDNEALVARISELEEEVAHLKRTLDCLVGEDELVTVYNLAKEADTRSRENEERSIANEIRSKENQEKIDQNEQHDRHQNLRFYNVPEDGGKEHINVLREKLENFIRNDLGFGDEFPSFELDRFHRDNKGKYNGKSRSVIVRFLSLSWRFKILRRFIYLNKKFMQAKDPKSQTKDPKSQNRRLPIIVRENLTKDKAAALKKMYPSIKTMPHWTFDGKIFWIDPNLNKHMVSNPYRILDLKSFDPLEEESIIERSVPNNVQNIVLPMVNVEEQAAAQSTIGAAPSTSRDTTGNVPNLAETTIDSSLNATMIQKNLLEISASEPLNAPLAVSSPLNLNVLKANQKSSSQPTLDNFAKPIFHKNMPEVPGGPNIGKASNSRDRAQSQGLPKGPQLLDLYDMHLKRRNSQN